MVAASGHAVDSEADDAEPFKHLPSIPTGGGTAVAAWLLSMAHASLLDVRRKPVGTTTATAGQMARTRIILKRS